MKTNEQERKPKGPLFKPDLSGKFLYLRHGQTDFNLIDRKDPKRFEIGLLNSNLNELGISQIKQASEKVKPLKLEAVYCSPLARTLETTYYALENHPDVKDIVVKVHPLLTETVNAAQDYCADIQIYKEKYNMNSKVKYDWSIFDEYFPNQVYQNCYVVHFCDDIEKEKKNSMIKEAIQYNDIREKFKEKIHEFVKLAASRGRRLESFENLFERALKFKKFLLETYKNSLNDLDKKVLCITHAGFIGASTSLLMYSSKEKVPRIPDGYKIENGGIISILVENA